MGLMPCVESSHTQTPMTSAPGGEQVGVREQGSEWGRNSSHPKTKDDKLAWYEPAENRAGLTLLLIFTGEIA